MSFKIIPGQSGPKVGRAVLRQPLQRLIPWTRPNLTTLPLATRPLALRDIPQVELSSLKTPDLQTGTTLITTIPELKESDLLPEIQLKHGTEPLSLMDRLKGRGRDYSPSQMPLWKKIVDHPKFSLTNIILRTVSLSFASGIFLSLVIPGWSSIGLSVLLEVRSSRASVNLDKE